jgi:hypothetical protein
MNRTQSAPPSGPGSPETRSTKSGEPAAASAAGARALNAWNQRRTAAFGSSVDMAPLLLRAGHPCLKGHG